MKQLIVLSVIIAAVCCKQQSSNCGCEKSLNSEVSGAPVPDEHGLVEGDIHLTAAQLRALRFRNLGPLAARWHKGLLPYELVGPSLQSARRIIASALAKLSKATGGCVTFREVTAANASAFPDRVRVVSGPRCHSRLGRIGGVQEMILGRACLFRVGTIQHEFMHALGFGHEQSRPDRAKHVVIHLENVRSDRCENFYVWGRTPSLAYDYESVMHYGSRAFTCNGQPTVTKLDGSLIQAQRQSLTHLDALKIRELYEC